MSVGDCPFSSSGIMLLFFMASIRSKDTHPEMVLWIELDHRHFRRYPDLPGSPDFGNKKRKIAIFVDGCFWHGCPSCYRPPATRKKYWQAKLKRNRAHDLHVSFTLQTKGFNVVRFWEHEVLGDPKECARRLVMLVDR